MSKIWYNKKEEKSKRKSPNRKADWGTQSGLQECTGGKSDKMPQG